MHTYLHIFIYMYIGEADRGSAGGGGAGIRIGGRVEVSSLARTRAGAGSWTSGPVDARGRLLDVSGRPCTCVSVCGNEAVIGSTDHALYAVDVRKGVRTRTLYTKVSLQARVRA